jgi:hypothetical protein
MKYRVSTVKPWHGRTPSTTVGHRFVGGLILLAIHIGSIFQVSASSPIDLELLDSINVGWLDGLQHGYRITGAPAKAQLGGAVVIADVNGDGMKCVSPQRLLNRKRTQI